MTIQKVRINGEWVNVDSSAVPTDEGYIVSETTRRLSTGANAPEGAEIGDVWIDTNDLPETLAPNSMVFKQTVTGAIDGVNKDFTTQMPYVANSLQVFQNGVAQSNYVNESNPANGSFSLDVAPAVGDNLRVQYQVRVAATGNADTLDGFHASITGEANSVPVLNNNGALPTSTIPGYANDIYETATSSSSLTIPEGWGSLGLSVNITTTVPNQNVLITMEGRSTGASSGAGNGAYTYELSGANTRAASDGDGMVAAGVANQSLHQSYSYPTKIVNPGVTTVTLFGRRYGGSGTMTVTNRLIRVTSR